MAIPFAAILPWLGQAGMHAGNALGIATSVPFLYSQMKGGYADARTGGPEGAMAADDALTSFLRQGEMNRDLVREESFIRPLSKEIERKTRFPDSLGISSMLDEISQQNFLGQRARRLAELSQRVDENPDILEIAHRLGLPIE